MRLGLTGTMKMFLVESAFATNFEVVSCCNVAKSRQERQEYQE